MAADFFSQIAPAAIGAAGSALVIGAPLLFDVIQYRFKMKRYLPLIRRSFEIIDPLLNEVVKSYGASDVRFAISLTTQVLADGSLSVDETRFLLDEIEKRYRPSYAAGKQPPSDGTRERAIYEAIKVMIDNGERPSLSDLYRAVLQVRQQVAQTTGAIG